MINNISNVAIVGGCGFIGHNLALHLKKNYNINVSIIDSLSVNNLLSFTDSEIKNKDLYTSILNDRIILLNKNKIILRVIDARNYHLLSNELTKIKPDIIVHLAAVSHANKSNKDPHSTFDHSLRTLENTLDWSRHSGTKLVYLSSSMVYGNFDGKEVDEEANCSPIGIYGALKFAAEKIIIAYNQVFDLNYTIIRPSALYGERCISRRVGQIFIENALFGKKISINGLGDEKLDFTYILDLIQGISKSIGNEKAYNQIFNITFGEGREILKLIEIIKDNFSNIEVEFKERSKLVPVRGTLSNAKSKDLLGYRSEWPLEKGYQQYISWYKDFFDKKMNVN